MNVTQLIAQLLDLDCEAEVRVYSVTQEEYMVLDSSMITEREDLKVIFLN